MIKVRKVANGSQKISCQIPKNSSPIKNSNLKKLLDSGSVRNKERNKEFFEEDDFVIN